MCKEIQTVWTPGEPQPAPRLLGKQRGLGMMSVDSEAEVWGMGYPATLLGPDGLCGPGYGLSSSWLTPSLTHGDLSKVTLGISD